MRVYLREGPSSVHRQKLKVWVYRETTVHFWMIIWAMVLLALPMLLARINFVIARMILLLFPPVTVSASVLILTAVWVAPDEVFNFPILAKLFLIIVHLWFSPQVLPVVSVDTIFLVMVLTPWTPCRLKVKDVKVWILWLHQVKQIDCYLLLRVRKSTHLAIFTIFHIMWISLAELTFILFWMVELLDPIVRLEALLTIGYTLVMSGTWSDLAAHLTGIGAKSASPILLVIVIEKASFWIVLRLCVVLHQKGARLGLELCQVQEDQDVLWVLVAPVYVRWVVARSVC